MTESRDALRDAIENGDLATVKQIAKAEPGLLHEPLRPGDVRDDRPMTTAAVNCQAEILSFLIAERCDVMEASNFPLCRAATRGNCIPTMELLVQHGADVNRICDDYGPPIIHAVEGSSLDSMAWLLDNGAEITGSGPGSDGPVTWNALKHAGYFNRRCPGMLALLLEHGADVNSSVIDPVEGTPRGSALHNVAEKGDIAGVKLLLAHGADPNTKNEDGQRPVEVTRNRKVRELLENA